MGQKLMVIGLSLSGIKGTGAQYCNTDVGLPSIDTLILIMNYELGVDWIQLAPKGRNFLTLFRGVYETKRYWQI